jgi:hypothetical protein
VPAGPGEEAEQDGECGEEGLFAGHGSQTGVVALVLVESIAEII